MKTAVSVIIFLLQIVPAYAQGDLSSEIAGYFFQPIKMEKIPGMFNGFYMVLPDDKIPYEEVAFFSNKKYPMKYYSNSLSVGKKDRGSIISLFNQEFNLGKKGESVNYGEGTYYIDIHLNSTWWLLTIKGRSYFCSLASQRGGSAYSFVFLLFDITDKQKIKLHTLDTFSFGDVPLIGFLSGNSDQLCILRTVIKDCFVTVPYAITDDGFSEFRKANGVPYRLKFEWSKWKPEEIKIINVP